MAFAAIPGVAIAARRELWRTYSAARFGTSIRYPERFRPSAKPDSDDGQNFMAEDGATLRVWSLLNVRDRSLEDIERDERERQGPGETIFDAERGERWFSFRGRRGPTDFFYRHYVLSHGNALISAFEVTYSQDRSAEYAPIVARMAKSLRPGRAGSIKGSP
jgi:hypothetical protein